MCKGWKEYGQEMREEGREEGREAGRAEGVLSTLAELVQKGIITVQDAAAQAEMTSEEFEQKLKKMA